jgi:hypothetical protein
MRSGEGLPQPIRLDVGGVRITIHVERLAEGTGKKP